VLSEYKWRISGVFSQLLISIGWQLRGMKRLPANDQLTSIGALFSDLSFNCAELLAIDRSVRK
jgi:hypothetical protein